jgi:hypothetical protein
LRENRNLVDISQVETDKLGSTVTLCGGIMVMELFTNKKLAEDLRMAQPMVVEGTGQELERFLKQQPHERFRLTRLVQESQRPFYERATAEEWVAELRAWASSHNLNTPPLSEEAISRDSIYEGRG